MKFFASLLLAGATLASPTILGERQAPDPDEVYIINAKTAGTGCPAGSVTTTIAPDRNFVTLLYDNFVAFIGPGAPVQDKSKNCQIQLNMHYPGGFQYSIVEAAYHGYALLDEGVIGSFISTYFFSHDASATCSTRTSVTGPLADVYTKVDRVGQATIVWSPCGTSGIINANSRISLSSSKINASGLLTNDDATFKFEQKLLIQWRPCRA